jgi:hypothetical protein
MNFSIPAAETGMSKMRDGLQPGFTENQLWSLLYQSNIAMSGEGILARLLASRSRTNPCFAAPSSELADREGFFNDEAAELYVERARCSVGQSIGGGCDCHGSGGSCCATDVAGSDLPHVTTGWEVVLGVHEPALNCVVGAASSALRWPSTAGT